MNNRILFSNSDKKIKMSGSKNALTFLSLNKMKKLIYTFCKARFSVVIWSWTFRCNQNTTSMSVFLLKFLTFFAISLRRPGITLFIKNYRRYNSKISLQLYEQFDTQIVTRFSVSFFDRMHKYVERHRNTKCEHSINFNSYKTDTKLRFIN